MFPIVFAAGLFLGLNTMLAYSARAIVCCLDDGRQTSAAITAVGLLSLALVVLIAQLCATFGQYRVEAVGMLLVLATLVTFLTRRYQCSRRNWTYDFGAFM